MDGSFVRNYRGHSLDHEVLAPRLLVSPFWGNVLVFIDGLIRVSSTKRKPCVKAPSGRKERLDGHRAPLLRFSLVGVGCLGLWMHSVAERALHRTALLHLLHYMWMARPFDLPFRRRSEELGMKIEATQPRVFFLFDH